MSARIISTGPGLRKRLSEIARGLDKAAKVRIGFLENATYPDGKPVAMIAAIQEFGAPARNIPPRPFFRQMIAAKSRNGRRQLPILRSRPITMQRRC